jgi:hypothetical protein
MIRIFSYWLTFCYMLMAAPPQEDDIRTPLFTSGNELRRPPLLGAFDIQLKPFRSDSDKLRNPLPGSDLAILVDILVNMQVENPRLHNRLVLTRSRFFSWQFGAIIVGFEGERITKLIMQDVGITILPESIGQLTALEGL